MVFYLFRSSRAADLVAFSPTPSADRLPPGKHKHTWQFWKQVTKDEIGPTSIPWELIIEQVSCYGYCLVQGTPAAGPEASPPG